MFPAHTLVMLIISPLVTSFSSNDSILKNESSIDVDGILLNILGDVSSSPSEDSYDHSRVLSMVD